MIAPTVYAGQRRVVIIDDHPLVATSMQGELERAGLTARTAEVAVTTQELLNSIAGERPDCVLLDLGLPFEGGGAALVGPLVALGVEVVVLTGETDPSLLARCAGDGAAAVLSKGEPLEEIVDVVARASAGEVVRPHHRHQLQTRARQHQRAQAEALETFSSLSRREEAVLAGLMDGRGPAEQASRDYLSVQTVRTQVKSVLRKLGVGSQLEAVARAHRSGWRPSPAADRGPEIDHSS